jgi:hypothetical protein
MITESSRRVTDDHLKRDAFLYVRQAVLRQELENTENQIRQYALRDRALALGWPLERIHVIDCDQGLSGASVVGRKGFQELTTAVGKGRAGIVLVLEVSRFSRNYSDLQKFLEVCALTGTLILDEKGIYDLRDFNDRLLLGLKWVMGREIFMPCRRRRTPARKTETKLSRGKPRAGDAGQAPGLCGLRPPFPSRTAR